MSCGTCMILLDLQPKYFQKSWLTGCSLHLHVLSRPPVYLDIHSPAFRTKALRLNTSCMAVSCSMRLTTVWVKSRKSNDLATRIPGFHRETGGRIPVTDVRRHPRLLAFFCEERLL